jgi:hypothetical protein
LPFAGRKLIGLKENQRQTTPPHEQRTSASEGERDERRGIGDNEARMSSLKCPKCGADIGSVLAAHAGRATSRAKAAAARLNAKKGGWPKGRPRKKTTA